jgi:hypothetical protein
MAELRYRTLRDVVDRFVPVVCSLTHQGVPVNLGEMTRLPDVMRDDDKVVEPFVVVPARTFNAGKGSVAGKPFFQLIERQHRAAVWTAIWTRVKPEVDDVVMVSDVDEIPDPDYVTEFYSALEQWNDHPFVVAQRMHSDRLTLMHPHQPWYGTTVSRWHNCDPHRQRHGRDIMIEQGFTSGAGIHLSWFGTDEQRAWKVHAFSHGEVAATYDPTVGRQFGIHSNGEILDRVAFPGDLWWPKPLTDGSFDIPQEWQ